MIEILDWDTKFFELEICRINGIITGSNDLSDVLKELKKLDIDLGYYSSPIPLNLDEYHSGLYDINLVDKKITFLKKITGDRVVGNSITEFKGEYPDAKLLELAIESGIYSRFNVDKKIGRSKYEALYKAWINNSVNKKIASAVLVYLENQTITGFVTLGEKNTRADIGIISVDNDFRGKGIGKSLMYAAENWFANKNYIDIQVVTQGDNLAACRLYECCGFKIEKVEYFYHLWKKENA